MSASASARQLRRRLERRAVVEPLARPREPALERVAVRVVHERPRAARGGELRDAGTHGAGAEDADDHDGTSALMPVSARPMISFWICEVPS